MPRTSLLILSVATLAFALTACGNKGPLVLPDKPPEQQDKDKKKDQPTSVSPPASTAVDTATSH